MIKHGELVYANGRLNQVILMSISAGKEWNSPTQDPVKLFKLMFIT